MGNHTLPMMPVNGDGVPLEEGLIYCDKNAMDSTGSTHTALLMPDNKGKCIYVYMIPSGCVWDDNFSGTLIRWTNIDGFYILNGKMHVDIDDYAHADLIGEPSGDFELQIEVTINPNPTYNYDYTFFRLGLSSGPRVEVNGFGGQPDEIEISLFGSGEGATPINESSLTNPIYIKYSRSGDDFSASFSLNGVDFTSLGTSTDTSTTDTFYIHVSNYFTQAPGYDFDNLVWISGCPTTAFPTTTTSTTTTL